MPTTKRTREESEVLVHGTTKASWEKIKELGLNKMARQHIHFVAASDDVVSAGSVPRRTPHGTWDDEKKDILIFVDKERAERDGINFVEHINGGNTFVSKGIKDNGTLPLAYFEKVLDVASGDILWEPVGACALPAPPVKRGRVRGVNWSKKYFKVDFHSHILPATLTLCNEFAEKGYITLEKTPEGRNMLKDGVFFRAIKDNCYSAEAILKDMEANDIDVQVLSTVPVMFCYWTKTKVDAVRLSQYINDDMAEVCKQYPKKFIPLGQLPLQFPDEAIKEMRRCVAMGFKGFQIGTHVNNWELSDENLFPVFAEAEKLDVGIMVHPWDMMGAAEHGAKYWLPWLVGMPAETTRSMCHVFMSGLLNKLPKLRILFAHGGGSFAYTAGRIQHGYNCRPDLCATDAPEGPTSYLANSERPARFWVDSLTHDVDAMKFLIGKMGDARIIMGSDYPFPLGEWVPGRMIEDMNAEGWDEERKQKLLALNTFEFLGMEKKGKGKGGDKIFKKKHPTGINPDEYMPN